MRGERCWSGRCPKLARCHHRLCKPHALRPSRPRPRAHCGQPTDRPLRPRWVVTSRPEWGSSPNGLWDVRAGRGAQRGRRKARWAAAGRGEGCTSAASGSLQLLGASSLHGERARGPAPPAPCAWRLPPGFGSQAVGLALAAIDRHKQQGLPTQSVALTLVGALSGWSGSTEETSLAEFALITRLRPTSLAGASDDGLDTAQVQVACVQALEALLKVRLPVAGGEGWPGRQQSPAPRAPPGCGGGSRRLTCAPAIVRWARPGYANACRRTESSGRSVCWWPFSRTRRGRGGGSTPRARSGSW